MEFKHAFHVFVDNFSTTYKLLLYRLIVLAVTVGLCCAVIIPIMQNFMGTFQYEQLRLAFSDLWADIVALNTENLHDRLTAFSEALAAFRHLIWDRSPLIAVAAVCLALVYLIDRFLVGVGNYVTGALLNDRMVMHANSPFSISLFKNLKHAVIYSAIYAPIAFVYDLLCVTVIWAIISVGLKFVPIALVKIFLVAVLFILFTAVKFTFITDWLPALIHSKMTHRKALAHTFSRNGKNTATVFSNILVLKLMSIALNVAALLFTFGAGLLITLPATALIQLSFSFVNYFDRNKLKYFVDEYTVIGPKKEAPVSREEFFKGSD